MLGRGRFTPVRSNSSGRTEAGGGVRSTPVSAAGHDVGTDAVRPPRKGRPYRCGELRADDQTCRVASISRSMSTFLLTTTPPASNTPLNDTPKSSRLIDVVALKPTR